MKSINIFLSCFLIVGSATSCGSNGSTAKKVARAVADRSKKYTGSPKAGKLLASVTFSGETSSGLQEAALSTPLNIRASTVYVVSYNKNSKYATTNRGLASAIANGPLSTVSNGVYNTTPGSFPSGTVPNWSAQSSTLNITTNETPAGQDYSPGLGDNVDGVHWSIYLGNRGNSTDLTPVTNYDQALNFIKQAYNITNGTHQLPYILGEDVLRWGTAPDLIEDTASPLGNGTTGSGYARFKQYVADAHQYNADVAQILEVHLQGSERTNYSPALAVQNNDRALAAGGTWNIGWRGAGYTWNVLSMRNMIDHGHYQAMCQRMINDWGFGCHIYFDALNPDCYKMNNANTSLGGSITTVAQEWAASQEAADYIWNTYAISNGNEMISLQNKGHTCYFTGCGNSCLHNDITDDECLNIWGNSVVFGSRTNNNSYAVDLANKNLVWGCDGLASGGFSFQANDNMDPYKTRFFGIVAQYLYMLQYKPLSYINNSSIYQVTFSGNLVSTLNRTTSKYSLTQGSLELVNGNHKFVPQVGAGCKIFAYSGSENGNYTYTLPSTWNGITQVDLYSLSLTSQPSLLSAINVTNDQITFNMTAYTGYLIVPHGNVPTPITITFNNKTSGDIITTYNGVTWNMAGNPDTKVQGPSAEGGFGTNSVYIDNTLTSNVSNIAFSTSTILHSVNIGNLGGTGSVTLHSSTDGNNDVTIALPAAGEVKRLNTVWKYSEVGNVTIIVSNSTQVRNVLFDSFILSSE